MSMFRLPQLVILLVILVLGSSLEAAELRVTVRSTASDVIYLDKGRDDGLEQGMQGSWQDDAGNTQLVIILFAASAKASAHAVDGSAMPVAGQLILFDVEHEQLTESVMDSLIIRGPEDDTALNAIDQLDDDSPSIIPDDTYWWRSSYRQSAPPDEDLSWAARSAFGARGNLGNSPDRKYRLQLRHLQDRETNELDLDEAVLAIRALKGELSVGRFPGVGRAFPGALDGATWSRSGRGSLRSFELAAGMGQSALSDATPGAGMSTALASSSGNYSMGLALFHMRGDNIARTGLRVQAGARKLPFGLSFAHWLRSEASSGDEATGRDPWQTGSRLAWAREHLRVHLQHRGTEWSESDNPDSLVQPASRQQLRLELELRGRRLNSSFFIEGRDEKIRSNMESLAGIEIESPLGRARLRVTSEHQLGPVYAGSRQSLLLQPPELSLPLLGRTDLDMLLRRWNWSGAGIHHSGQAVEGGMSASLAFRMRLRFAAEVRREDGEIIPAFRISLGGSFGK
jgi:hypothetical protein